MYNYAFKKLCSIFVIVIFKNIYRPYFHTSFSIGRGKRGQCLRKANTSKLKLKGIRQNLANIQSQNVQRSNFFQNIEI